jgi:hypothetical protein
MAFAEFASANWPTRERFPVLRKQAGRKEEENNDNE